MKTATQTELFFNTTKLRDPELQQKIDKCKGQQKDIYNFFINRLGREFNWSDVMAEVPMNECSLKRSISVLKKEGFLLMLDRKKKSTSGELAHLHTFNISILE